MIASLAGTIASIGDRFLIVETGGVGYQVFTKVSVLGGAHIGDSLKLFTYHHVAETANDLYGFADHADVAFFEMLLSISGIGPKSALNVMNLARRDELIQAIQSGDATLLTKVSGIGKKTAERIVLELAGKLEETPSTLQTLGSDDGTVIDALVSLGYSRQEARDVTRQLPATIVGVSERIREALKHLGNHGR